MDSTTTTLGFDDDDGGPESAIGPYRLLRQVGEGGMGVVYHARQSQPIRRDVAVKVIKPGMDTRQVIARFEAERQALAVMDHPNIAYVFDAGTTPEGRPYFVMELVNGVPITHYCDSKRLSVRERVELFIPVCLAIQHAHQKGIIHRDIKPSNILVAELEGTPVPKVIDFGLAKVLGHQSTDASMMTNVGTIVGTPSYMSPEQAELKGQDVDTRSDVYSLGAVLYELITGSPPLKRERLAHATYVEVLERIREDELEPPSTRLRHQGISEAATQRRSSPVQLRKLLHGELDWITMKALEKARSRRYETVNWLARDLRRYLDGEPVEAGPVSTIYRMRKFVRRNRGWLATAGAFAALLIAGIVVSGGMALRASRAEDEARAVSDFLRNDVLAQASSLTQARPDVPPDPELTVRTALERAAARIEGKFDGQPLVEASIRQTIAETYIDLGLYREAPPHADRALALRRSVLGEDNPDTLDSMYTLAVAYNRLTKRAEATELFERSLAGRRRVLGSEHSDTLSSMRALATALSEVGKYAESEPLHLAALDTARRILGPDDVQTLAIQRALAVLYLLQNKYSDAEPLLASALETRRRVSGEEHPDTLIVKNDLATSLFGQGKWNDAETLYSQLVEIRRRVSGEEHPTTLIVTNNLARVFFVQRKYEQAARYFGLALEGRLRTSGELAPATLDVSYNLGELDQARGEYRQAEARLARVLDLRRRSAGPDDRSTLKAQTWLGEVRLQQQKFTEAEDTLRSALDGFERSNSDSWERYHCENLLGATLAVQKKYAEAEPRLIDGYEGLKQRARLIRADYRGELDKAGLRIVQFYRDWGKLEKAAEWKQIVQPVDR